MSDPNESLRRISIFADIPDSEIVQIEAKCAWQSYPPGVNIIDRMSTSRNVYFITKGMVRVMVFSENGREISLDDVEAGMFFGELSAIDGAPRFGKCCDGLFNDGCCYLARKLSGDFGRSSGGCHGVDAADDGDYPGFNQPDYGP